MSLETDFALSCGLQVAIEYEPDRALSSSTGKAMFVWLDNPQTTGLLQYLVLKIL